MTTPPPVDVEVTSIANGGDGVARDPEGRVVFVSGALPGERVSVEVVEQRSRHARARAVTVLRPAPERVVPRCPHVAEGCGGCDWQHVADGAQPGLRQQIVRDALSRIGRVEDPPVVAGLALPSWALRTTMRAVVEDGRAGFRRRGSHDPILIGRCSVTHPAAEELLVQGRFGGADEVTVRVGARTAERMVIVHPTVEGVEVPADVVVVAADAGVGPDGEASIVEEAAGRRWRISASSFFQSSPEGAEALVGAVRDAVAHHAGVPERLIDLCGGVGLFAGTVDAEEVVLVESSRSAVADAEANLADRPVRIIRSRLERWRPEPAPVVVADPPRAGLGRTGVAKVVATEADVVVLVSCDAGALGRDVGLLVESGYRLERAVVLDLFAQTSHVEVVSTLVR